MYLRKKTQARVYTRTNTYNCENTNKTTKIIAGNSKLAREPEKQWETHENKILKLRRKKNEKNVK